MLPERRRIRREAIDALKEFMDGRPFTEVEETAIPSYVHKNPIVWRVFWGRVDAIVNEVERLSPKSTLDFGCGSGVVTALLDTGIDRSVYDIYSRAFDFLQSRLVSLQNVRYLRPIDVEGLRNDYDVIIAADVLEHFTSEQLPQQLRLFHKWLKPSGRIVISGPTENLWYKLGRMIAGFSGHYHRMNIKGIERELTNGSLFECTRSTRYPVPVILEGFIIQTWRRL